MVRLYSQDTLRQTGMIYIIAYLGSCVQNILVFECWLESSFGSFLNLSFNQKIIFTYILPFVPKEARTGFPDLESEFTDNCELLCGQLNRNSLEVR